MFNLVFCVEFFVYSLWNILFRRFFKYYLLILRITGKNRNKIKKRIFLTIYVSPELHILVQSNNIFCSVYGFKNSNFWKLKKKFPWVKRFCRFFIWIIFVYDRKRICFCDSNYKNWRHMFQFFQKNVQSKESKKLFLHILRNF